MNLNMASHKPINSEIVAMTGMHEHSICKTGLQYWESE